MAKKTAKPEFNKMPEIPVQPIEPEPVIHTSPNQGPGETVAEFKKRLDDDWKRPRN